MSSLTYFNGILLPEEEINITLKDRAYLYGEGLFETMKATQGFIPFIKEHLSRFFKSSKLLNINFNISPSKLEFAITQTLLHNHLKEAYVRVTVTRLNEEIGGIQSGDKTNLIVMVKPLKKLPGRVYEQGISAEINQEFQIIPDRLSRVKSTNYIRNILAAQEAAEKGFQESLFTNIKGHLVEGASSNLFLYKQGHWITPSLDEGPLPGITRKVLLELMKKNEIPFVEGPVEISDLQESEEAILTNAIRELLPLTKLGDTPIGTGHVGPKTGELKQLYQEEVQYRFENFVVPNLVK